MNRTEAFALNPGDVFHLDGEPLVFDRIARTNDGRRVVHATRCGETRPLVGNAVELPIWCERCGCNIDATCVCARGCTHHPISVTVPDRVRRLVVEVVDGNPNHGRGAVGESLAAKLAATTNRQRVELTTAERLMLINEADTMYEVSGDDASWEPDAKNDRQAARTCLRKLGVHL